MSKPTGAHPHERHTAVNALSEEGLRKNQEKLLNVNRELAQRLNDLNKMNSEAQDSRRAALNLMEDAVRSRRAVEELNRKVRESERRFREMIDALPVAIYTTDAEGRLTHFNPAAVEFSGRTPDLGSDQWCVSWKLFHPDGTPMPHDECLMAMALKDGHTASGADAIAERPDGKRVWFTPYPTPLRDSDGRIVGGINMLLDITERKQAETWLTQFAAELEQRVSERTSELAQSEHRLRALATELNLAEQRERKRLATDLHDYLAQLLVLCRMTLGQVKKTDLSPRGEVLVKETEETLNQALTYCRTLMAELSPPVLQQRGLPAGLIWLGDHMKRQELTVSVDIPEAFDLPLPEDRAVLLFQSVRELLINVAKHGALKEASVRMNYQNGLLKISVRDENGFDLAAAAAASDTTSSLSSKFGLFSIRERMKALGGAFEIESAPGQGTTATLVLPVARRTEDSGLRTELSGSDSALTTDHSPLTTHEKPRIRVLLVDDHVVLRQGLRSIVAAYAHLEVIGEAGDGIEAVTLAQQLSPDVVVMDINMPRMDGIEATRRIKEDRPDTIVIGLSVNQSADTERQMKAAGAFAYLRKETAVDALCQAIEEAVAA